MDIFVRQIPLHATENDLKKFFRSFLAECGITTFELSKFRNKPLASITVLDSTQGHLFLLKYGANVRAASPLKMNGCLLKCSVSKNQPSDIQLRTLALEHDRQLAKQAKQSTHLRQPQPQPEAVVRKDAAFTTSSLSCGSWIYNNDKLAFQPHFMDVRPGRLILGAHQAVLLLRQNTVSADRVDINYHNIDTVLIGDDVDLTVTFTCYCPPKFYRQDDLSATLAQMDLKGQAASKQPKKTRVPNIDRSHELAAGMCFIYRVKLSDHRQLARIHLLIKRNRNLTSTMIYPTQVAVPARSLRQELTSLEFVLTDQSIYGHLPFGLRFQVLRLVHNSKLLPEQAHALLPHISLLYKRFGETSTVEAVRRLYLYIYPPGPHTEAFEYSKTALEKQLEDFATRYDNFGAEDAYSLANRHSHIVLIHRINVTPAGTYLEGPTAEVTNRVLRSYPGHSHHFLRVSFMDEDGESVRYDPRSDQSEIYHGRFKAFLDGSYNIAGQGFSFLGFSHSSLRSQTCWFMSTFVFNDNLAIAPLVIKRLGDFSGIRSPARCAARIGQAFTDTTGTVEVEAGMFGKIPDIERNGRVFSDGVGTISESLLRRIWRVYGIQKNPKPTVLQIRYAGAKGVVSLDSRLPGDQLNIRPSMDKFPGSSSRNIEICGAAFRPLPMILNRGYIKILEDLGVPIQTFMRLQEAAVEDLRLMTSSTINASTFLTGSAATKAANLPSLLEHLSDIGLKYQSDPFLRDIVEMVVITNLRDIKYRGRIPVRNGITLYGIMDETGYLQEGEIYVVVEKTPQGGKEVLTGGKVIVTRSPALHPGDIRTAKAINVPESSTLSRLSNCVVFSQHGTRDLPSQLSGGDLDGDLYNVIFEPSLMPRRDIAEPADYPRVKPVELSREVGAKDMSDFFVNFMETDQLGQISTVHVQLADQKPAGIFDPDCIKLAQMASTAVDFSKTGIPVNMQDMPKRDRYRPDFMAPSPRTAIETEGISIVEEHDDDFEDDPVTMLDPESRPIRYYRSEKALGHLYRAIDEHQFLNDLQKKRKSHRTTEQDNLMPRLWDYVKRNNVFVEWEHNRELARQIKEAYENTLLDLLYQYAPSPTQPLTESELFAGTILGRAGGAQTRRLREMTGTMRDRFGEILDFTVSRIINGDDDGEDRNDEALPRAIACLAVGIEESGIFDRKLGGELKSWKYLAAGVCLKEMKRFTGYVMLPGL